MLISNYAMFEMASLTLECNLILHRISFLFKQFKVLEVRKAHTLLDF